MAGGDSRVITQTESSRAKSSTLDPGEWLFSPTRRMRPVNLVVEQAVNRRCHLSPVAWALGQMKTNLNLEQLGGLKTLETRPTTIDDVVPGPSTVLIGPSSQS